MKVKSESEVSQSCPTLLDRMDCSLPGSSTHEIFQARVLEWAAITFSDILASTCYCLFGYNQPSGYEDNFSISATQMLFFLPHQQLWIRTKKFGRQEAFTLQQLKCCIAKVSKWDKGNKALLFLRPNIESYFGSDDRKKNAKYSHLQWQKVCLDAGLEPHLSCQCMW